MLGTVRRWVVGSPLATERMKHERLGKAQALAVLASDGLSSVAYATEEILLVLILAGTAAVHLSWPIALGISALLIIVASSYYQTVHAYPGGGGAYLVTRDNLGTLPSLVAGAALLIDYVLTVAVSTSAGVAAITSAFPALFPARILLAIAAVVLVTIVNLRGVRESGRMFALPTYFFIVTMFLLIFTGLYRAFAGAPIATTAPAVSAIPGVAAVQGLTAFLLLRAFASGCTALTGLEAIADGVPIFKRPEAKNAGQTLLILITLLVSMFVGITWLSLHFGMLPHEGETVVSQLGRAVFGEGPAYFALQAATALILLLAANTSYSDFPRLSMWIASDRFMPRQFMNLGDRLVYNNGIIVLGTLASILILVFRASTHALIPLYAVGVFISFTLSQTGMVRRWWRLRVPGWQVRAFFNGVGAVATGVVMVVIAASKFIYGAWIILILIPVIIKLFHSIRDHYELVAKSLSMDNLLPKPVHKHTIIVPVASLHRGVYKAMQYAQTLGGDLRAVTVELDPEAVQQLQVRWQEYYPAVTLVVIPSPYRSVVDPLVDYIHEHIQEEGDYVTVVMPEFVPARRWHNLLHNQTAWTLKLALLYRKQGWQDRFRIITEVPFYLSR